VDDASDDKPEDIVQSIGAGRVEFFRQAVNGGVVSNFNTCISRSRGALVHILHGDDMVAQGFYVAYRSAILSHPEARTIIGQVIRIDEADRWIGVSSVPLPVEGGAITDFARLQATTQLVQFPAVVVHRDAYERVGGFCTLFKHVCDWDMWFRLGQFSSIATVPRPYGLYRKHNESDTSQQVISANNMREIYFVVSANIIRLNGADSLDGEKGWRSRLASFAETIAWELSEKNCTKGRFNQALWAWRLEPKIGRLVMLMKSWLKHKLNRASKE